MDLSDTLHDFIKFTGNFLEAFEKNFQLKTGRFVRIFQADFALHFFKTSIFPLFLTYNLLGVSYGHDIFTNAKI